MDVVGVYTMHAYGVHSFAYVHPVTQIAVSAVSRAICVRTLVWIVIEWHPLGTCACPCLHGTRPSLSRHALGTWFAVLACLRAMEKRKHHSHGGCVDKSLGCTARPHADTRPFADTWGECKGTITGRW